MKQLVIGSKPLVTITLRSYEISTAALMLSKSITSCDLERDNLQREIDTLKPLIDQATDVLKNMED